MFYKTGNLRIT